MRTEALQPRDTVAPLPALLSVVICTRNRPESIMDAVESVVAQSDVSFELIVVDQSHGPATRDLLAPLVADRPHVHYVHLERPGLSHAYNEGTRRAAGTIVAYTDDDCVAPPGWLESIARAFQESPDAELIYGQVLLPPHLAERENVDGVTPQLPIAERRRMSRTDGFKVFGMGANFALKRAAWERVGGFDEVLGGGGPLQSAQDFDFAYRVYRAGGVIMLEPSIVVFHYGFRTARDWPAVVRSYGVGVGGFYSKHARLGDVYAARLLAGAIAGAAARGIKRALFGQPHSQHWTYLRNVISGVVRAKQFHIDREHRLYVSTVRNE